jgi:aldose 1-epimerase
VANEPPSGRQFELRHGTQRAVVVEVGGGLREYEVNGQAVLDGYAVDEMAGGGRGQPLLPWPNRLADGEYVFEGMRLQLPLEEVAQHNAIHGLTRWLNWGLRAQADDGVTLGLTLHPRPGYPFTLGLSIQYSLETDGLRVRTTATNLGYTALPFGAGQHPYLTVGTPSVDSASLHLPARTRLELDPRRGLPTGRLLDVSGTEHDFLEPRQIGSTVLDDCFTDLQRDASGYARVRLTDATNEREVVLWMDASYRYVQAFSGDTLPAARRRGGLALEPMTCPPNAFRSGADLIVLQPNQTCALEWGLKPR